MVSRIGTYFNKVRDVLPLLEEILDADGYTITRQRAIELAMNVESIHEFESASQLIDALVNYKPQPILIESDLDDNHIGVPAQLQDTILWITKKMQLESSNALKAIIQDIKDQTHILDQNLHGGEMKVATIAKAIRRLDRAKDKMQNLALNNLEAIEASVRSIESASNTWPMRQEMAADIQSNHILPMGEIIEVGGLMQSTINQCAIRLLELERLVGMPKDIIARATNLRRSIDNSSTIVQEKHKNSMLQIVPLLKVYATEPSRTVLGAIKALKIAETKGLKSLKLNLRLGMNSWRLDEVWDDDSIYYLLIGLSDYEPNVESFEMPTEQPEVPVPLSVADLLKSIQNEKPIADILQYVLDNEAEHTLGICVSATLGALIQLTGDEISFTGHRKFYSRNGKTMEAMPIAIKG